MIDEPRPCPKCGSRPSFRQIHGYCFAECSNGNCSRRSDLCRTVEGAIASWNGCAQDITDELTQEYANLQTALESGFLDGGKDKDMPGLCAYAASEHIRRIIRCEIREYAQRYSTLQQME